MFKSEYMPGYPRYSFNNDFYVTDLAQLGPEMAIEIAYYKDMYKRLSVEIEIGNIFYFE